MGCINTNQLDIEDKSFTRSKSRDLQFEVYAAIMGHRLDSLKELIEKNFSIRYNMPSFLGRTALHIAAEYGDLQIVCFLIEKGADLDCVDNSGCTPIFIAMQKGHLDVVSFFIDIGADVNIKTRHGLFLHDYICQSKFKESMLILKKIKYSKLKL